MQTATFLTRWRRVRDLWNEWDPLRLGRGGRMPRDDYEQFVGPTLHLMDSGAGPREISAYVSWSVASRLGAKVPLQEADLFAERVLEWHRRERGRDDRGEPAGSTGQFKTGSDGR